MIDTMTCGIILCKKFIIQFGDFYISVCFRFVLVNGGYRVEGGHVQESEHRRPCRTEDWIHHTCIYLLL